MVIFVNKVPEHQHWFQNPFFSLLEHYLKSELKKFLRNEERMEVPYDYTEDKTGKVRKVYDKVMLVCWKKEAQARPSFKAINEILSSDLSAYYSQ